MLASLTTPSPPTNPTDSQPSAPLTSSQSSPRTVGCCEYDRGWRRSERCLPLCGSCRRRPWQRWAGCRWRLSMRWRKGVLSCLGFLLSSSFCLESQREAALLLGQFAAADSDCKVHIVQRGAVHPLIDMLESPDIQIKEMSAFALGRLAQVGHIQIFQIPTFPMIGRAPQVVLRKGTLQYIIILQLSDREHYRNRCHTRLKANQVTCTTFTNIPIGPRGGPSWVLANGLQVSTKFGGKDISHS